MSLAINPELVARASFAYAALIAKSRECGIWFGPGEIQQLADKFGVETVKWVMDTFRQIEREREAAMDAAVLISNAMGGAP